MDPLDPLSFYYAGDVHPESFIEVQKTDFRPFWGGLMLWTAYATIACVITALIFGA